MNQTLWNKSNATVLIEQVGESSYDISVGVAVIKELVKTQEVVFEVYTEDGYGKTGTFSIEGNTIKFSVAIGDRVNQFEVTGKTAELVGQESNDDVIVYTVDDLTSESMTVECNRSYSEVASLITSFNPQVFLKEIKDGAVTTYANYGMGVVEDSTGIVTVDFGSLLVTNSAVVSVTNIAVSHFDDESIEVNVAVSDIGGGGSGLEHLLDGQAVGSLRSSTAIGESPTYNLGASAFAVGNNTMASGTNSFAEGNGCLASGNYSHAQNNHTLAQRRSQTVIGEYNVAESGGTAVRGEYALIVGNGVSSTNKSNAFAMKWNGDMVLADGTELTVEQLAHLADGSGLVLPVGSLSYFNANINPNDIIGTWREIASYAEQQTLMLTPSQDITIRNALNIHLDALSHIFNFTGYITFASETSGWFTIATLEDTIFTLDVGLFDVTIINNDGFPCRFRLVSQLDNSTNEYVTLLQAHIVGQTSLIGESFTINCTGKMYSSNIVSGSVFAKLWRRTA